MNETQFKKLFGERVRKLRKKNNLTQEKLSEMLWMDPQHFCKMENGIHFPTLKNLINLANVLDVDIKDLFSIDNSAEDDIILGINMELKKLDNNELSYLYKNIVNFTDLKKSNDV